jgi:hypothetical protein
MTTYETNAVTNGLSQAQRKLVDALRVADPDTRFKMACNQARSGNWVVVAAVGEPGFFERVQRAVLGSNLDLDTSGAVDIPMKNFDSKGMM